MTKKITARVSILATTILLAACSVKPVVISEDEHQARVTADKAGLFSDQVALTEPLTLYQAMARAISYNLDHRLKLMEDALANDMLDVSNLDMLPQLAFNAGYRGRDNYSGASSRSLITGNESLEVSTSQEKDRLVADLGLSWNLLDFGVSYYRARQQADRIMIVAERRRKVIHNIIQDVRNSYWRALTAQKVLADIEPLIERVESAIKDSRRAENNFLSSPVDNLLYQRRLLTRLKQLQKAGSRLMTAKSELAALMSLPPGTQFSLSYNYEAVPEIGLSVTEMEEQALQFRPELREEGYHDRISALEVKRNMASLMPSLTLSATYNHDSNKYNYNSSWLDFSSLITGNLVNLITLPQRLEVSEAQQKVVDTRRLALSIAVMSQVHIAMINFSEAKHSYQIDDNLLDVETRLLKHADAEVLSESGKELNAIEMAVNALLARLHRGESYAALQSAYGQVYLSIGADPLPAETTAQSLDDLAASLHKGESSWIMN